MLFVLRQLGLMISSSRIDGNSVDRPSLQHCSSATGQAKGRDSEKTAEGRHYHGWWRIWVFRRAYAILRCSENLSFHVLFQFCMLLQQTSASATEHNTLSQNFTLYPRNHPIWNALLRPHKRRNNIRHYTRFSTGGSFEDHGPTKIGWTRDDRPKPAATVASRPVL